MIFFYKILTSFFYPFFILLIYSRTLFNKEDKVRFKEKIFLNSISAERDLKKKLIWFHAASIGEVQSIFPVIEDLKSKRKNIEFLITTITFSSGDLVKKKILNCDYIQHRYLPIDVSFLIKKFLKEWKPNLVIFVDSEIWPNLIFELKKQKISLSILNARLTKKTFKRWMMIKRTAKKVFGCFDLCLASDKFTKDSLNKLGATNIKFIGNIKFSVPINYKEIFNQNEKILTKKRFWCAVSTHKGEEEFCLKTHTIMKKKFKDLMTIIIPRHISRSNNIKKLCDEKNLTSQVLNDNEEIKKNKDIIIINSFGVLLKYLKYSKSVFIGKSMIKKIQNDSGQNPIEAAKLSCKIYHGPYFSNFKEIYNLLSKYKISEKVNNEKELTNKLSIDLKNPIKNFSKQIGVINNFGKKILKKSTGEIKKIINI
tara:strand:- start:10886 stop:12160 length:1275 start_codon:yes stop_codon:yes gene_type:complete